MKKSLMMFTFIGILLFANPILMVAENTPQNTTSNLAAAESPVAEPDVMSPEWREAHQNEPLPSDQEPGGLFNTKDAGNLAITTTSNVTTLINNFLVPNSGIYVTDVDYVGSGQAAGTFTDGPFNIDDGIILSTGRVIDALPPNISGRTSTNLHLGGCDECDSLADGYTTYDAAVLTITFDVAVVCSTITFDFIFGSEEYPEYVGTPYNDVFGAYLNGNQVAFDPDSNPITINGGFFTSGYVQVPPANGMEFDGSTLKLRTTARVVPGSTGNVLKLVICDASDHVWDSGVLLASLEGSGDIPPCTGIPPEFLHPPTPNCADTIYTHVNEFITFDLEVEDPGPNNDTVTLTVSGLPTGASMSPALPLVGNPLSSTFSWTPTASDIGVHQIIYTATDSELDSCQLQDICRIYVRVCPSAPICNLPPDQTVFICGDTTLSFPVTASDGQSNPVSCALITGVGTLDNGIWSFQTSGPGVYTAEFECTDECGGTCGGTVNITVQENTAPTCSLPSNQSFFICDDSTFTFPVSATDTDGNLTGCTMTSGAGSFDGSDWTFTATASGVYSAVFECSDACGETCGGTVEITVIKNSAPVCSLPPDQNYFVCGDTTFTFPISASDTDGNLTGCTMVSGDGSFDGSNWSFTTTAEGTYSAAFECTDACGAVCGGTVTMTVNYNEAPVCNIPADQNFFVCGDTTFTFPVSASDGDGNLTGCTKTSGVGTFDGTNWTFTTTAEGTYSATFECTDACGEVCGGTVNITVDYNEAPVCSIPSDQNFFVCGDTTFSFPVSAADANGNLSGCTMVSGDGSLDGSNWTFTTTAEGTYSATFECADACGETCGGTVNITVNYNEAPVCNIPGNQSFFICDDTTFTFPVSASDADGNLVNCTMLSGAGSFDGSDWTFTTSGPGIYSAEFQCVDACGEVCGGTVDITVTQNSAPVCNLPSNQSYFICEDSTFTFPISASDSDGNLTGCIKTSGAGTFNGSVWTFTTNGAGVYSATFECEDACGETCSGTVSMTVAKNSAPICNLPSSQSFFICDDTTFTFPVSATDNNNNLVNCTMLSGPGSFDGSNWTFTTSGSGVYSAAFECVDACGETCGGTVNITVTQNSAPVCNLPSDQSFFICNDSTFSFPVSASDVDGNLVNCVKTSGPGTFNGSVWTFTANTSGVYSAVFTCTDACGEICSGTVNINVTKNSAPTCNLPADQSFFVCEDSTFSFPISAADVDGNLNGCVMTSGVGSFDGSTWTFTSAGSGTYSADFECTDDCGQTCSGTVTMTVTRNSAPVCNIPADQSFFICGDTTFIFPISASDTDNNLSGCTITSGPGSFDGSNWTFTTSGAGVYTASFECTDDCGEICSGTVNITVTENSAPVCSIPSDQSFFICDDTTFTFPVSASDTDNNLSGCTMTSGPGSFDGSNWTFTTSGAGVYSASFECADACGETCTGTLNITVSTNSAPVCSLPSDQSFFICADTTFSFPVSASDVDGNLVGCSLVSGSGTLSGGNWEFTTSGSGTYSAVFECVDECGETCGGTVNITVTRNSAPVCSLPPDANYFTATDTTFTFPVSASDVDGNLVGCTMLSGPGTFDGSNWTFTTNGPGVYSAEFQCEDVCGATCGGTVNIVFSSNSAPQCNLPANQSFFICEDTTFNFIVTATDDDENLVGCSKTSGPGTLTDSIWSFTTSGSGVYTAHFVCTDSFGEICGGTVSITVTKNSAPVCSVPSNQTIFQCTPTMVSLPVSASDVDNNLTGCSIVSGPGTLNGGNWEYTPSGDETANVTIQCIDECGAFCEESFAITFDMNATPVCNIPSDQSFFICDDTTFTFPISASDADGNLTGCTMTSGAGSFDGSVWTFTTSGSGTYSASFECEDACGETCSGSISISVTQNTAPVCNIPSNQNFFICEDTTFSFPISASDVDGNLTGCAMTSGAGSFDGSTWTFTTSGSGSYSASFECEDACGETCTGSITIDVTQNSAPVCNIPSDQSFFICADTTFSFPVSASDADGNLTGCTMTSGAGSFDGSVWSFTTSGAGVYSASFECSDACGEICTGTVNITVNENSAPVCNIPSDQSFFICDDTTFTFPISASDIDGNLSGCTMTSGPGTFDGSDWTFTTSGAGVYTATFECTDDCGAVCDGTLNITVTANSAPTCNIPANQSFFICADTTFTFPVSATDPDNNLTGCTMTSGTGTFDGSNWSFTTSGAGVYSASFRCTDACGEICTGSVSITVTMNSAPVCDLPSDQNFFICDDTTFSFPVSASDADGNLVGCNLVSGTGSIVGGQWIFSTSGAGVYSAEFECVDACGAVCGGMVSITVTQNTAPVCNIPGDQTFFVCGDTTFTFPVSATDVDNNLSSCVKLSGPGTLSAGIWTLNVTQSGVYTAEFRCTDACGETCSDIVSITVVENSAPVCSLPSDQSFFICNDSTFNFTVSASDTDNNLTGCSMISGPGSFDGSTWTFTAAASGVYSAEFECADECGAVCGGTVNITITKNSAPVCSVPNDTLIIQCDPTMVSLPVSAADADGNLVGCAVTDGPGVINSGFWEYTPAADETVTVTVTCTDECGAECSDIFAVSFDVNEAPVCNLPSDQSFFICADSTFTFAVSADDPDGNLDGCTMISGPGSFDGSLWTFTATASGIYTAEFECSDICGVTCGGTANITVTMNSAPVCNVPADQQFDLCADSTFSFAIGADDTDNNLSGCTMLSGAGSFDGTNWTFTTSGSGVYSAEFECVDDCGALCSAAVTMTVNVNSAPVCNVPANQTFLVCDDSTFSFQISADDIDGNLVSCVQTHGVGTYDGTTWTFTTNGPNTYFGAFVCTDACGAACQATVVMTVNYNLSEPVCEVPKDTLIMQCEFTPLSLPVSAFDPDGNLDGCALIDGPGELVNGYWEFTPTEEGTVAVTVECSDLCGLTCQETFQVTIEIQPYWAVLTLDRSGSMSYTDQQGASRFDRAKLQALSDLSRLLDPNDSLFPGHYKVALMHFNSSSGIVLEQDFTDDSVALFNALEGLSLPRHDTPLAAAMCQANCILPEVPGCIKHLFTYTNGWENESASFDMCTICEPCLGLAPTGWNYDCDPLNPGTCTDWQMCFYNSSFATNAINFVHYYDFPADPFDKDSDPKDFEDLYFLKAIAEETRGQLIYHSDGYADDIACGDANNDWSVNVSDAVYIINFVFSGGNPPDPYWTGDVNCDGHVNVSDAVYLINYVFSGGNAPCDSNGDNIPDC